MSDSPLESYATAARLRALAEAELLDAAELDRALAAAARGPDGPGWRQAIDRVSLAIGAGLTVAGVVFFFAANWSALAKWGRIGILMGLVLGAAGIAAWRRETRVGRVALTAAAGFTGGLLAVYGQTYQTGADAWNLFAAWAALILPWTIAARFEPLWLLWLVVFEVGLGLWWDQVGPRDLDVWVAPTMLAVLSVAWAVRERVDRRGGWFPRLLGAVAIYGWAVPVATAIFGDDHGGAWVLALGALCASGAVVLRGHRPERRIDLVLATVVFAAGITLVTSGASRVLLEGGADGGGMLLLLALLVIGQVGGAAVVLRRMWQAGAR